MSADNWDVCPKCWREALVEYDAKSREVIESYGKVPVEDFDAARAELKHPAREDFRTFHEDYEFWGAHTGEVEASYRGGCSKCGLRCEFTHTERFFL